MSIDDIKFALYTVTGTNAWGKAVDITFNALNGFGWGPTNGWYDIGPDGEHVYRVNRDGEIVNE